MKFGGALKWFRKSIGWSQEKMALSIHKPRSSISKLESDLVNLSAEDFIRWAYVVAQQRAGKATPSAYEFAAMTACAIDVQQVMEAVIKVLGG